MIPKSPHITKTTPKVSLQDKENLLGQKGMVLWMTGFSGSGKSTIAHEVEKRLFKKRKLVAVLDGDNVRYGLNADLGFSPKDREENLRRIAEVAKLFAENGIIVLTSFISPSQKARRRARKIISRVVPFSEVYIKCPISECEKRDPKGLYKKVRIDKTISLTGVNAPYEDPVAPELILNTEIKTIEECARKLENYILTSMNQAS